MKLIHISDIHINPEPILESNPIENFERCMTHIENHHLDAEMVVISGDLTHHGQRSSYVRLREMIDQWKADPLLMIGNHDHRETFQDLFPEVGRDKNGYVQYVMEKDEGDFVFLDTVLHGTHAGHFGEDRQAWLKAQLDRAAVSQRPVFLFMHHNPVEVGVKNSDLIGLTDGKAFRTLISEYKSVIRHIFFGHCHYILSGSVCGIPMSAPRSTNHPCVPEFSGEDILGYAPYPPTYNVCLLSDDAVVVHSIDFMDDDKITWLETTSDGWIAEEVPQDA
ncbi:MAG: metallophosphoesterase [Pseudomonadota bacterium]